MSHAEYVEKAKEFIARHGKAALVARRSGNKRGERYEPNIRAWGAWRAYFQHIGYPLHVFDNADYWTVPSLWPHEFDPAATIAADHIAGDEFAAIVRREQAKSYEDRKLASAVVNRWRETIAKVNPLPPPPPLPQSSADLKTPARPASDALRATMGLPPRPKIKPKPKDEEFVEGFDI